MQIKFEMQTKQSDLFKKLMLAELCIEHDIAAFFDHNTLVLVTELSKQKLDDAGLFVVNACKKANAAIILANDQSELLEYVDAALSEWTRRNQFVVEFSHISA